MARRRKSETKPAVKVAEKPAAVRKSRRQIAKKQLDKKVNGESTTCMAKSTDSDELGGSQESDGNPNPQGGTDQPVVHKKFGKYRCTAVESNEIFTKDQPNRKDSSESSDSQDAVEPVASIESIKEKLGNNVQEEVMQIVGGIDQRAFSTLNESCTDEVVWQEDVIEETIEICEEMEVEEETVEEGYTISQEDGSVVLEEVLLVNNHDFEGEGVVEFTVIRDDDGTESMVVSRDETNLSCKDYIASLPQSIKSIQTFTKQMSEQNLETHNAEDFGELEQGIGNITVAENEPAANANIAIPLPSDKCALPQAVRNCEDNQDSTSPSNKVELSVGTVSLEQAHQFLSSRHNNKSAKESLNVIRQHHIANSIVIPKALVDIDEVNSHTESQDVQMTEDSIVTIKSRNKLDRDINFSNAESHAVIELNKDPQPLNNSTDHTLSTETSTIDNFLSTDTVVPDSIRKAQNLAKTLVEASSLPNPINTVAKSDLKLQISDTSIIDHSCAQSSDSQSATKSNKDTCSVMKGPSDGAKEKGVEDIQNNDESSGDSEVDTKADTEDIKVSSSSDNSNDTLLSSNSYKLPEFSDIKNIPNQQNEAEKKTGFRSRSGSTDTTGSESGSNSSGIRRSSRIRSIGLMKQRSRGRGLVTKPNLDLSRAIFQQDREKLVGNLSGAFSQDSKDNSDNQSETQSDRESSGNKTVGFFDSPAPLVALIGTTGYESDTSKPVKVKSRWRRSSELEMGGCGSAKVQTLSENDASGENVALILGSPLTDAVNTTMYKVSSGKTTLPTVPEIKDKEMEERLRQFEHLRENLYLTERYTNKETKRMVCDCFLTDEEIARGELGCGEDCLNRLLMIECGARCVVGERCTNKRFQNCEYAKCEVFRTDKKGFGLRATSDLQSGEFLMEYVGEVVDPKDFRRRAKDYSKDKNRHYYFMALKSDQIIDATGKGNISRFINHSCDPNSETQKWTVNGELRIGFFNKQFIAAGEEITFDYHFQRYGKEAQKCYCEAENCRGWIGETPEEEKEKIEKKEKQEKDVKKKKEEKKIHDYMEDEDLEEEIEKLCSGGLQNRAHTLMLSRLMVRSRELEHRTQLLRLIQSGEQPCRRLFLDYHGLRLIWSYMMDVAANTSSEAQHFRLEILKTLNTLPIPNKTMLMDSKVFAVVEKWAKQHYASPTSGSPEDDDQTKPKIGSDEPDSSCDIDSNERATSEGSNDAVSKSLKDVESGTAPSDVKQEIDDECRNVEEQTIFTELANSLLCDWSNLKEVFRIPKKERIEQMKEHEREADRGYKEDLEKEDRRDKSYERPYRSDRYGRGESDKRSDRRRGRESPDFEYNRLKDKRSEERVNLVPIPRMSKYERRQLFAMKVAKEEEERQRRQQQETWQEHEARCLALGMDPHTTAALDPQTGYPLFFNPSLGQWQHYPPIQDTTDMTPQCPVYIGAAQTLQGHPQPGIIPQNPHMIPSGVLPPVFTQSQPGTAFGQMNPAYPLLSHHHEQFTEGQLQISNNLIPIQNGTPQVIPEHPMYTDKTAEELFALGHPSSDNAATVTPPPPLDLPPKWKSAKDAKGRTYYYNITDRVSQWLPPPPDHFAAQPETSSSSESSEESTSSDEDDDDLEDEDGDEDLGPDDLNCAMEVDHTIADSSLSILKANTADKLDATAMSEDNVIIISEPKKRRDGLVQERIISPRREEERSDHKKYKETKDKLRRQKEKAKLKEQVDKFKKHRRSSKSKSHSRHTLSKLQAITADPSTTLERKIKDTFRINMANVMVHFLNPYRKNDCKQGRITNTEDFKHLARKLTHFVLAKELKHCKSVDELQCNENVKHKAKDFVRKYMSKFGAVYQKGSDED